MNVTKTKIEDICNFVGGSQPPKSVFISEQKKGYIRLIQTRDYKTDKYTTYIPINSARRYCTIDDIMIGRYGPPIFQIMRGIEGAYNVALMKAIPKTNILNDYLFYFLKQESILDYVEKLSLRTGGQTGVDLDSLNKYPVLLPDLLYQKKVINVLKTLDDKIELNNRINSELEAMAKTLYDYWFVQFDFPNAKGKPYKTSSGKMVWNEDLKREIPLGWEVKELMNVATTIMRGISPIYLEKGGICVLNQKCIREQKIDFEQSRRHNNEIKNVDSRVVQYGDVLVNSTGFGTLGRVAIVKWLNEEITTVDSHITIVRCENKDIKQLYIGYTLLLKQSEIESLAEGSTGQTELSRVNLGKIKIIIPPTDLQVKFENILKPQFQKMANNEKENKQLTELRDWLLPMLMNGQVKVK